MSGRELFERWAPKDSPWTPWTKPVLFAASYDVTQQDREAWHSARDRVRDLWTPPPMGEAALVLDLEGPEALALALECARHGYRPVPLFNSCIGSAALVGNEPIRAGLELGAVTLQPLEIDADACPAFVLDARRMSGSPAPRTFDNRWLVFPQDLPSAVLLRSRGVRRAVLVQRGHSVPRSDLAHVLLRWQRAGIEILAVDVSSAAADRSARSIVVTRPSWFRFVCYRLLATLGLRRSSAGGFGAVVPEVSRGHMIG